MEFRIFVFCNNFSFFCFLQEFDFVSQSNFFACYSLILGQLIRRGYCREEFHLSPIGKTGPYIRSPADTKNKFHISFFSSNTLTSIKRTDHKKPEFVFKKKKHTPGTLRLKQINIRLFFHINQRSENKKA